MELFGLSAAFTAIGGGDSRTGRRGLSSEAVDRASLVLRFTNLDNGITAAVLGDLRGENFVELANVLGPQRFRELFAGVRVLEGFQHHLGVLSQSGEDRAGLELVLREILSQEGRLDILVQSQTTPHGRQTYGFLNRSLIEALRQLGVDVVVALEPSAAETLGNVTVDQLGNIQVRGGSIERFAGDARIRARFQRYADLKRTLDVLRTNRDLVRTGSGESIDPQLAALRDAQLQLGRSLGLVGNAGLLQRVLTGVGVGEAQAQPRLTNQGAVDPLIEAALRIHPAERILDETRFTEFIDYLQREGPVYRRVQREISRLRQTGRVSRALVDALGELDPEFARQLLANPRIPEETRRRLEQHVARVGAPAPLGWRVTAGALLAVELANQIGPVIAAERARSYQQNVSKFLGIILWWQEKGVVPEIRAIYDRVLRDDQISTDPTEISRMLEQRDIDYLALTRIVQDSQWDRFNIWMIQHVRNYDDYRVIVPDPARWDAPLRWQGDWATATWQYRAATIEETFTGYELRETWLAHPRLDIIMHEVVRQVIENTERELAEVRQPGRRPEGQSISAIGSHVSRPTLAFVQPVRRVRFKPGTSESDRRAYALLNERRVLDGDQYFTSDPVFYVFEPRTVQETIDPQYLLVAGADFNTYARLVQVASYRIEIARIDGLEQKLVDFRRDNPSGLVLIRASAVEDLRDE